MVSTMQIELNGTLITGRVDGLENFTLTLRRADQDGRVSKSFGSELTFYDDGYTILKAALVADPFGFSKEVNIKLFDQCCSGPVWEGIIRGDAIDWCEPGCYISANPVEDEAVLNCIKSTLIWDNHAGFLSAPQPIIRYCIEIRPEFLHYLIIALSAVIVQAINFLFLPLLGIGFLASFFGSNLAQELIGFKNLIRDISVPCGRFHPSPFVRSYIQNACAKCGISFSSTILNNASSPYWNTVLMAAQVEKGRAKNSTNYSVIDKNLPTETLESLLRDYLEPMFNAEYRLVGNTLYFERKDYFQTTANWVNFQTLLDTNKLVEDSVCWSWIDRERWSFGEFKYQLDASDYCANEALDRWNRIVEWNSPYNPGQSGRKTVAVASSCARFREDGIDTSVYDFMRTALGGLINFIFFNQFDNYREVMLIPKQTFFNYKFLIFDTTQGTNGMVARNYSNAYCGGNPGAATNQRFNYPFWFRVGEQGVSGFQNNLYSMFHYIDNPRRAGATNFNFSFTFNFDCNEYASFSFDKNIGGLVLNGATVNGKINELTVDFNKRTIRVNGIA